MEFVDSHCHIQSVGAFEGERSTRELWAKANERDPEEIIRRARDAGVIQVVCVGCELEDSKLAVSFAQSRDHCWASVGIHPHESHRYAADAARKGLTELAGNSKVVAIGECGLDYYYEHSPREDQARLLKVQIELALKHNLPIIFHVREAFDDFWEIFDTFQSPRQPIRGVLHSFTDSWIKFGAGHKAQPVCRRQWHCDIYEDPKQLDRLSKNSA